VVSIINTLQIGVPAPPPAAQAEATHTTLRGLAPLLLLPDSDDPDTTNDDQA
jgi:hypothetical protein